MDRRRFEGTEVRIDSPADLVRIKTYYPHFTWCCSNNSNNPEVKYTVRMPKTLRLVIRDHRSETEVSGLQGALNLTTQRGTARLHGLGGALHLDTHRGEVQIEFASFKSNSSVTNYCGTVDISIPKVAGFDLQTNSGRRGSIDTNFAVMTHTMSRRGETIDGAVNGGGPALRIVTERGEIHLRAK